MVNKIYKKKKGIVFRRIMDEMVLLDPKKGEVLILNEIGGDIWELIDGNLPLKEIVSRLSYSYEDVDLDTLKKDVEDFIAQLVEAELIEEVA